MALVPFVPFWSFVQSWTAFTWPITTGFTASRWEGFGKIDNLTFLPATCISEVIPKWYFTSPELPQFASSPVFSWNSANIFCEDLWKTFLNALSLPLWAIPNPIYSTPCSAAVYTSWSKIFASFYLTQKSWNINLQLRTSYWFSFCHSENASSPLLLLIIQELSFFPASSIFWLTGPPSFSLTIFFRYS